MRKIFFLLCLIFLLAGTANSQVIEMLDSLGDVLVTIDNDRIRAANTEKIILTVKGNLIFQGNSDNQKDIIMLVKASDIFSKRTGEVLSKNLKKVFYIINNGRFFLGNGSVYNPDFQLGYFERVEENDNVLRFYGGNNDIVLAEVSGEGITTGKLTALFYLLSEHYGLEEEVSSKVKEIAPEIPSLENTYGNIRRLWDTGMDEFEWDGQILTRKWNSFDFEEWTYDGTVLKRAWYPGNDEFTWDGKVMKRRWYPSPDEFEWDGTILRRRWGSGQDAFIIQGNIVKRYFDTSGKDEWEIDGDLPIPVIALIVFNLIGK